MTAPDCFGNWSECARTTPERFELCNYNTCCSRLEKDITALIQSQAVPYNGGEV